MPARRGARPLPSEPAEARAHLRRVAEECFERYGVHRVTMDEIAAAAGISRPTLYRYFGDRDSLIKSIVEHRSNKLVGRVHRLLEDHEELTEKLVAGLLHVADAGHSDQFILDLLRSASEHFTSTLMLPEGTATAFAEAVWAPVFKLAADAGALPADFDERKAYRWLISINFMLLGWPDYAQLSEEYKRDMLRRFVVPAFVRR